MKIALATTTIHIPHALHFLRALDSVVAFFVAADKKTPPEVAALCAKIPNCFYISVKIQQDMDWTVLKHLPWNSITRRNVAVLEALKWGADVIVVWDDDNFPLHSDYFLQFASALSEPFAGLEAHSDSGWFDPGELLWPRASHRGFPRDKHGNSHFEPVVGAEIGVVAGACMGDPDISAVERIANAPIVHGSSVLLQSGIVVDPRKNWTVFNTQNTAYRRALAPAMLLCPQFGRYDDIVASLIAQYVMRGEGMHVRFGPPAVWQNRNPHSLVTDLGDEMWGMKYLAGIADWLDSDDFLGHVARENPHTIADKVLASYEFFRNYVGFPEDVVTLAHAWHEDIERVL